MNILNFIIIIIFILSIFFNIINIIQNNKEKYNNKLITNTLSEDKLLSPKADMLSCIEKKIAKGKNLQSSIAWCLFEFLIGPNWDDSQFKKIVSTLDNKLVLSDVTTLKIATCPDPKTGEARETCAFTGDQCICNNGYFPWIGADCQTPPQNACPRNPKQQCSCGGSAVINALLNDISNIHHIKIDSIDNVYIPNLLDKEGTMNLTLTISVPDLFIEGGAASASAQGYFCPSPNASVGASVKGLGCTVGTTIQLKINVKISQSGSYISLHNTSIDFEIKSFQVYNGVGWVFLDIFGIDIPLGIELGGVIVNILSATNVFFPWFITIINSLKSLLLNPLNDALAKLKIPIGSINSATEIIKSKNNIDNDILTNNILTFNLKNHLYYRYYDSSKISTNFNHSLGTHFESLKKYSKGPTKCKFLEDIIITKLINTIGNLFMKLKPSYDLSNVKTKKLITPSSITDKLGDISTIKRSDSTYAYSIALGLINFNFNFMANLTKITGINLTKIKIPKDGVCIKKDKTISLVLNNDINNINITCNIDSGGNLYIPYTTETIIINAKPSANITFTLQLNLNGDFKNNNILVLDEEHCTLTFSNVKINIKSNLTINSSESYFKTIFDNIAQDVNNLFSNNLSPLVSTLVQNNLGHILKPEIINKINNAKIQLPL